jgi:hypothetical protein
LPPRQQASTAEATYRIIVVLDIAFESLPEEPPDKGAALVMQFNPMGRRRTFRPTEAQAARQGAMREMWLAAIAVGVISARESRDRGFRQYAQ